MKVTQGTAEYQESVRKSKEYLLRLNKGKKMLEDAVGANRYLEAQQVIRLWNKLANELFVELEIATILHQSILTGNSVVIRADGTLVKVEDLASEGNMELDPWTLLSMEKLKNVFGDELHNFLHIEETPPH